jgi:hypothetical protein
MFKKLFEKELVRLIFLVIILFSYLSFFDDLWIERLLICSIVVVTLFLMIIKKAVDKEF